MDQAEIRTASRSLSPRVAFWAVAYALVVSLAGTTLPTPLYRLYREIWHFSPLMLTVIFCVYMVGVMVALLFFGRLSDQIGRRRVLISAVLLAIFATVMAAMAPSMEWLIIARFIIGLSSGLLSATSTAALTELHGTEDRRHPALVASICTIAGLGSGPLLAGVIAQVLPEPLVMPYVVELVLLAPALIGIWAIPETRMAPPARWSEVSIKPRIGVPHQIRGPFIVAGGSILTGFCILGYFTSLLPSYMAQELHIDQVWIGGAIVTEMFAASCLAQVLLRKVSSGRAMILGLLAAASGFMIVLACGFVPSLPLLIAGTALGGLGQGLSFMGSLALVNHIAPHEQRGEVVASYFIAGYFGGTVPVFSVGAAVNAFGLFHATAGLGVFVLALVVYLVVSVKRLGLT